MFCEFGNYKTVNEISEFSTIPAAYYYYYYIYINFLIIKRGYKNEVYM